MQLANCWEPGVLPDDDQNMDRTKLTDSGVTTGSHFTGAWWTGQNYQTVGLPLGVISLVRILLIGWELR